MKKLNKVLAILCTGAIAVSGVAAFTACGGGHDHNAHLTYVSDGATQHHGECSEDDYKTALENHTWGTNNKCTKCGEDKPAEVSITLDKTTASVEVGKTVEINATVTGSTAAITATSGTPANATASVNGKVVTVTGVKEGTSVITVSCGGASKTCTVTVTKAAEVSLSHEIAILEDDGDLKTLEVTVNNVDGEVTADTDNHEVATAAYANGKVTLTAVHTGKTELTVNAGGKDLKCTVEVATYGLKYGAVDSTYMTVADGENRTSQDIYVPGYWEDADDGLLPVTEILAKGAENKGGFEGKTLTSIYTGDNVTTIGADAFNGAQEITTLKVAPVLRYIGDRAFNNCSTLTTVVGIEESALTEIGQNGFLGTGLVSITLPKTMKKTNSSMFNNCANLETVRFLGDIEIIYGGTFMGCLNLKEIWIPKTVHTIENTAFYRANATVGWDDSYPDFAYHIYYQGTEGEWNSIEIASKGSAGNKMLGANSNLTMHYEADFDALLEAEKNA
ncbi:MAG: leucine-rich repeat protein [Clostridia bacterium]|nr:leucine-rich repeat protein [Clostridia bacterium]